MANISSKVGNSLSFQPLASAPSDPRPGQLYVDSADDNKLKQYVDNVGWVAIGDVQGLAGSDVGAIQGFTTENMGTPSSNTVAGTRVGDSLIIEGVIISDTTAASPATLVLPLGLNINSSYVQANTQLVGTVQIIDGGGGPSPLTSSAFTLGLFYDGSSANKLFFCATHGSNVLNKADASSYFSSGSRLSIKAAVPIAGWSSNVTMASDPAALPSAISYYLSANQAVTANVTDIAFDTVISDPKSLYSAGVFTADVAGIYSILTSGSTTTGSIAPILYKNGVATAYLSNWDQVSVKTSAVTVQLAVGDTLSIRSNTTDTIYGQTLANGGSTLSIARITGSTSLAIDNPRQTLTMGVSATPPGYGSSGTATLRFDVTLESQGSEITYVDSATDGGRIVVSTAGVYAISGATYNADGSTRAFGLAYNSTDLTVSGGSIPITERVASFDNLPGGTASTGDTVILEAGSYITMQCDPSSGAGGLAYTFLRVTKIASIG